MKKPDRYIQKINQNNAEITELYEQWAKQKGIQYSHFLVLYALVENDNITQKQISERTHLIKQTVNVIIQSFQKKGYITLAQDTDNRKEKRIFLTDEGKVFAHSIIDEILTLEEKVAEQMGSQALQQMANVTELFKETLQKEMNECLKQ